MNGTQFVYVTEKKTRDEMLALGYLMLRDDEQNNVYVFKNTDDIKLSFANTEKIFFSDTLTF